MARLIVFNFLEVRVFNGPRAIAAFILSSGGILLMYIFLKLTGQVSGEGMWIWYKIEQIVMIIVCGGAGLIGIGGIGYLIYDQTILESRRFKEALANALDEEFKDLRNYVHSLNDSRAKKQRELKEELNDLKKKFHELELKFTEKEKLENQTVTEVNDQALEQFL